MTRVPDAHEGAQAKPKKQMPFNKIKKGYFTDEQGNPSLLRLGSLASLAGAIMFGIISTTYPEQFENDTGVYITLLLLSAAFAPKALDSFKKMS